LLEVKMVVLVVRAIAVVVAVVLDGLEIDHRDG
jgi:hypothetical protein